MKSIAGLTTEEERAAAVFRALGNPARIRIVTELAKRDACVAGDFVELLPLAQSTVSQHLKVLKEAGIIRGTIEGGDACYCLDPETIAWLVRFCEQVCGPGCGCAPELAPAEAPMRVYALPMATVPEFGTFRDMTGATPEVYAESRRLSRERGRTTEVRAAWAVGLERFRVLSDRILASRNGVPLTDEDFDHEWDDEDDE